MPNHLSDFSFAYTIHSDHDSKRTIMSWYEYGKLRGERVYDAKHHEHLQALLIKEFKGEDAHAMPSIVDEPGEPYVRKLKKSMMPGGNYWNLPFDDPYGKKE
jgi:hypothetical protein